MSHASVVYNPVAGSARGARVATLARQRLEQTGWSVDVLPTRGREGAREIARECASHTDLLVVVGGDGSLREAFDGLAEARNRVTVAFVPIGNANVAARELGIPLEVEGALELLVESDVAVIDLASFEVDGLQELVLAMVGIGWDALTVSIIDSLRHGRLGRIWYRIWADSMYVIAGLLAFFRFSATRFAARVDGEPLPEDFCGASICNFATYGKGMSMAPDADPYSGLLHQQWRRRSSAWSLILHLVAAQRRTRVRDEVSFHGQGKEVMVSADHAFPVQIDGDYRGRFHQICVRVHPRAARIRVPRRSGGSPARGVAGTGPDTGSGSP